MEMLLKMFRFGKAIVVFALLLFILPLVMAPPCQAQVKTYGVVGGGAYFTTGGQTDFASFAGVNTPVYTDTSKGFVTFNRTGYFYVDRGSTEDVQALTTWLFVKKSAGFVGVDWYGAIGAGYLTEVESGEDNQGMGIAVEFGADIYKNFSISVEAAHQPVYGAADQTALMINLDLSP